MFLDVQGDRWSHDTVAATPMLRMVEKTDEGIVVRGWKAIGTGVAFANEIFMGVLWKPGTVAEQVVFALVPANDPNVTHVVRPSLAQPDADAFDRPLASRGDELDGMAYFDDVLIPWDRVFHIGNPDHAKFYPQRLFDWIHAETQIRHVVQRRGHRRPGHPHHRGAGDRAGADRRRRRSPTSSASARRAAPSRSPRRRPASCRPAASTSPTTSSWTSAARTTSSTSSRMIEILIDFCGRGVVVYPTKADLDNPEHRRGSCAPRCAATTPPPRTARGSSGMIHERFLTEWGARHAMFEKFNGTPLHLIRLLTMQRVEYQADGPLTELAREICGLGDVGDLALRLDEEKADYPSIRVRPDYVEAQDVQRDRLGRVSAAARRAGGGSRPRAARPARRARARSRGRRR